MILCPGGEEGKNSCIVWLGIPLLNEPEIRLQSIFIQLTFIMFTIRSDSCNVLAE